MLDIIRKIASLLTAAAVAGCMAAGTPLTASAELPAATASFMDSMGAGWNLGNTLDANGSWASGLDTETSWGNPKTTKEMIQAVHNAGFETIRIPVSWANHVYGYYKIDEAWMNRVKEVVDYAYDEGMHVIINIHHDNLTYNIHSREGYYPDSGRRTSSDTYLILIWQQIAETFKDYDERLIFETLNEPRLIGHPNNLEWASPAGATMKNFSTPAIT